MQRKAVIFDMDGVLVDSYQAHFRAWRRLAVELGFDLAEGRFASVFGRTNPDMIHALWPGAVPAEDVDRWADFKEATYREILLSDFPAMDGAKELLAALKSAGFALAVGSSGPPENIECVVEGLNLPGVFDAIVHGREVARGKPDPEVFLLAAKKLGIEPRRCAVVEDAVAGLEAARRARMTPIALVGTAPREALAERAALVVDSLRDLSPDVVRRLIKGEAGS